MSDRHINPAACTAPVYILEMWAEWFEAVFDWTERHPWLCFLIVESVLVLGILTS